VNKHFDGWGRTIVGYMDMVRWYQGDEESLKVIRNLPPFRYVVVPDAEIILDVRRPDQVTIRLTWPGGNLSKIYFIGPRVINSLRALYVSSEVSWRHRKEENTVIWKRRGKVIPCVWSNYYPVRAGEG
jgi:hypothetical protein